jgi:hypothetical protein
MKTIFFFLSFFSALSAFAASYEIVGPCQAEATYKGDFPITDPISVGDMTMAILINQQIPYEGSTQGINSMMNTPTGNDAIEILSNSEVRAYGWCYEVDGVQPALMPGEYTLTGNEHVRWFYAYSVFRSGRWVSYCEPAYNVKPAPLCPQ